MKKKLIVFVLIAGMLVLLAGCAPGSVMQLNTPVPQTNAGAQTPSGQIDVPGFKLQFAVPGPNPLLNTAASNSRIAGILPGIWHGIISPVTLVWSLLNPKVQMYEVHNNGSEYNFGFLIGLAILSLILGITVGRRRR